MTALPVLLASPPHAPADDLAAVLQAAGFAVEVRSAGTGDRLDFAGYSAIVLAVGSTITPTAAQTRLWRAEMGDDRVPVLWLLPFESHELAAAGLDSGADAVLARPVEPAVLASQVRALSRVRAHTAELLVRASESRGLNDELQKAFAQIDATIEVTRAVQKAMLPRKLPVVPGVRFAIHHRSRSRAGGDLYEATRLDEHTVGFWVADPGDPGTATGGMIGLALHRAVVGKEIRPDGYRILPPDEVVGKVNRDLVGVGLDPAPLVAFGYGTLDVRSGRVGVSRGGLPAPVRLPASGPAEPWHGPGPFLGAFEAEFAAQYGQLEPGERLILTTDGGVAPGDAPLAASADRHRERRGQDFADAIARDLIAAATDPDDVTVLVVERE